MSIGASPDDLGTGTEVASVLMRLHLAEALMEVLRETVGCTLHFVHFVVIVDFFLLVIVDGGFCLLVWVDGC